jgi:hypothetical protein
MHTPLSSYAPEGIAAVPVDVVVDGDRTMVVEPETDPPMLWVKRHTTSPGLKPGGRSVNIRTLSRGRSAPARSITGLEGLSDLTLTRVAELVAIECRQAGDTVVSEGSERDRVYILAEGSPEAYADGRLVRELAIGEPFGSISAVSHGSILETFRGRTALELYVLDRDDLTHVMAADRGFEERDPPAPDGPPVILRTVAVNASRVPVPVA